MEYKKISCPRMFALFEKRIGGDDALLDLARLCFQKSHIAPEFYAGSIEELNHLFQFNPFPDRPPAVHLPRGLDLFEQSAKDLIIDFTRNFAGRTFGFVLHDQKEIADRFDDYVNALRDIEREPAPVQGRPFLFVEYAFGLDPGSFINLFKEIRDLKGISACLDIGHIGLRQAQAVYSRKHPGQNIFSLRTDDPALPGLMDDIQEAVYSGREEVLRIIGEFAAIGKPVHFHLHDAHPLAMSETSGISDHLSFFEKIKLPFEYGGKRDIRLMFGPSGLLAVAKESLKMLGPENVSFSLEIHPKEGMLPLGPASYLFTHWTDKGNAERMNFWLSVLAENYRLLRSSCAKKGNGKPRKMIIYNIFPLLAGKLSSWEQHIIRASEMGFNWIFVNPIQKTGRSGSIYSIADYFSFNPLLIEKGAGKPPQEQVREMLRSAENLGLHVMVDLVINHCSIDADIIKKHPEWFLWESGKVAHPFADENGKKVIWKDLAKFDHRNTKDREGLIRFFLDIIGFLADLGFRGFRCDAAYQIPRSMWELLIKETRKKYPDVLFFAETLGCPPDLTRKTASAGFDYIFNSSKWWDFQSHWLMEQYQLTRDIAPSISFPESHDTVRLCEELNGNIDGMRQRYFFAALFSAGVMMPMGFEFGFRKKLDVVKTRPEDWEETGTDLIQFISEVNGIKSEYEIFSEDAHTQILHHRNADILLMWKASGNTPEESLIILNKDARHDRHFSVESIQKMIQAGGPLVDISPGDRMNFIPSPFSYDFRPGQGVVLMTSRDFAAED